MGATWCRASPAKQAGTSSLVSDLQVDERPRSARYGLVDERANVCRRLARRRVGEVDRVSGGFVLRQKDVELARAYQLGDLIREDHRDAPPSLRVHDGGVDCVGDEGGTDGDPFAA